MYFLAIIQNSSVASLFPYNTFDEALVAFHTELAYRGEGRTATVCVIMNEFGVVLKSDTWIQKVDNEVEVFD